MNTLVHKPAFEYGDIKLDTWNAAEWLLSIVCRKIIFTADTALPGVVDLTPWFCCYHPQATQTCSFLP